MKNKSYAERLREYELEKRMLVYRELSQQEYDREVRKLANKYGI